MKTISIDPDFDSWRKQARLLLCDGISPQMIVWTDSDEQQEELFSASVSEPPDPIPPKSLRIPKAFLDQAETASCHSDPSRWSILYRLAWRIARRGERHLLQVATDSDVLQLRQMGKDVRRDCHKMRAFVRFRKVGESVETGREQFVAWFEPSHHIVKFNAPFFRKRFTGMDWSILTPEECVHWNGSELSFTEGVPKSKAPDADAREDLWRGYYKSIFNPARLKLKAMQAEMPVKYWKNLPEASLIRELTVASSHRRDQMIEKVGLTPRGAPKNDYLGELEVMNSQSAIKRTDEALNLEKASLSEIRDSASCCRACPLWERATQTVFGVGPENARIMIVGEQPGDEEDLAGKPLVGPAGRLLRQGLEKAGLDSDDVYFTNAVKHFKWKPQQRGKRRLHEKANQGEMMACRPWLLGEIAKIKPEVIITLGNTPAHSLIREDFKILSDRGLVETELDTGFSGKIIATVHPSFLLRLPDPNRKRIEWKQFVEDLRLALE